MLEKTSSTIYLMAAIKNTMLKDTTNIKISLKNKNKESKKPGKNVTKIPKKFKNKNPEIFPKINYQILLKKNYGILAEITRKPLTPQNDLATIL